uniref:Ribosomal protein S7 n=1 Tax=Hepatozoon canis TaxID=110120 RepID=A0A3S8TEK6_9APIC|nr:ribosomal protein S7 [Hepatozoon canis]
MTNTNKIIHLIINYLNIKNNKYITFRVVEKILLKIKKFFYNKSPIFIIEKAIFNVLIPIKYNKTILNIYKYDRTIRGIPLKKCLSKAIISIINISKSDRNKPIVDKLFSVFIKIYKKEHLLVNNKYYYLNTLLKNK